MTPRLLTEIQAANLAGFRRFRDFSRAVKGGQFPAPSLELPDGPRWSESALARWIDGDGRNLSAEEEKLIGRFADATSLKR